MSEEYAGTGRRSTFPEEWGIPKGSTFSAERAAWVLEQVKRHQPLAEFRRRQAEARAALPAPRTRSSNPSATHPATNPASYETGTADARQRHRPCAESKGRPSSAPSRAVGPVRPAAPHAPAVTVR